MFAPTNASAVLNDLLSEELSLLDVAAQHNTTVADLSAWLELPAIAEKWAAITTIAAKRARAIATIALHTAARAMHKIVSDLEHPRLSLTNNPATPNDVERRRRQFDLVRRAAWLLYLISRTTGEPPRPRPAHNSLHEPPCPPATDVAPATSVAPAASLTASAPRTREGVPGEPQVPRHSSTQGAQSSAVPAREPQIPRHLRLQGAQRESLTNAQINGTNTLAVTGAVPLRPP